MANVKLTEVPLSRLDSGTSSNNVIIEQDAALKRIPVTDLSQNNVLFGDLLSLDNIRTSSSLNRKGVAASAIKTLDLLTTSSVNTLTNTINTNYTTLSNSISTVNQELQTSIDSVNTALINRINTVRDSIGDATLIIKKNGVSIGSFNANSKQNAEVNIEADVQLNVDWDSTSGVTLILNKPTKLSQFEDDNEHRLVTDSDIAYWNGKSNFTINIVEELPGRGSSNTLYFVPSLYPTSKNLYTEYMYINGAYEIVGGSAGAGSLVQADWSITDPESLAYIKNKDAITVELTKAEYDALTEEDLNNGTIYLITDEDATCTVDLQSIIDALGYTPANSTTVNELAQEVNAKMEFYKVTLEESPNLHFEHDGITLNYQQLADKYRDNKYFLFCEYRSVTFIPSLPPDYDPSYDSEVLEFTATWNYMNEYRISVIKINSDNQIKASGVDEDFLIANKTDVVTLQTLISNYNFLDNYWFIVNLRNATTWTSGYGVDRWKIISGTATVTSSGITLDGEMILILENSVGNAVGTIFTASVKMSSGNATASYNPDTKTFTITSSGGTIRAAKLERGTHSTLENDAEPPYAELLLKCMRFYQTRLLIECPMQLSYMNVQDIAFVFGLPIPLRTGGAVTISDLSFCVNNSNVTSSYSLLVNSPSQPLRFSIVFRKANHGVATNANFIVNAVVTLTADL